MLSEYLCFKILKEQPNKDTKNIEVIKSRNFKSYKKFKRILGKKAKNI